MWIRFRPRHGKSLRLRIRPFAVGLAVATAFACHAPRQATSLEPSLRIVTYNIKHGYGMDDVVDLERIADVLRPLDADVILLQEVDRGCARSEEVDQAGALGADLAMNSAFAPFRPYDGGLYGMAGLSKWPIESVEVVELPPGPNPLAALELKVRVRGRSITVVGLHLVMTEGQRLAQARFLVERYGEMEGAVVLAGDLNSERMSPVLTVLKEAFDAPVKSTDARTFPADDPVKEIDFILLKRTTPWSVRWHGVIEEPLASDHRPVLLEGTVPETSPPFPGASPSVGARSD